VEERALASGGLVKELRSGDWRKSTIRIYPDCFPNKLYRTAKEERASVLSLRTHYEDHFRVLGGEASRKAGCPKWARPV